VDFSSIRYVIICETKAIKRKDGSIKIRGKEKMEMFIGITFLVGLTMAKAKIEKRNKKHLASLVS
jgi:hypothetical protein